MFRQENGFTLVELLISLTIVGIISSIAVPGWQNTLIWTRGFTGTNTLRHALKYARSEAITRNQTVRICASTDSETCSATKDWENGWIIYLDNSGKSSRTSNDPIIKQQSALNGLKIRKNGREKTVKFNEVGWIGLNRSFSVCSAGFIPIIRIVIIHSGRMRTDTKNINCQ